MTLGVPGAFHRSPLFVDVFALSFLLQLAGAALARARGFLWQHLAGGVRRDADSQAKDAFLLFDFFPTEKPGEKTALSPGGDRNRVHRSILHPPRALFPPGHAQGSPALVAVEGVEQVGASLRHGGAGELWGQRRGRAQRFCSRYAKTEQTGEPARRLPRQKAREANPRRRRNRVQHASLLSQLPAPALTGKLVRYITNRKIPSQSRLSELGA